MSKNTNHQNCQLCDNPKFIDCHVIVVDHPEDNFIMSLCKNHYHEAGRVLTLRELEKLK